MEESNSENLRQQVLQTTNPLLRAVDRLEGSSSTGTTVEVTSNSRQDIRPTSQDACGIPGTANSRPGPQRGVLNANHASASGSSGAGTSREMARLFNWSGSDIRKRVRAPGPKSTATGVSKKKKLKMYKHAHVCLPCQYNSEVSKKNGYDV